MASEPTTPGMAVPSRQPLSRGWRIALIASAALNLLFVGGLISALVRHGGPVGFAPAQMPHNIGAYVGTLPPDRGRALWQNTADKRRGMQPLLREVREARREALGALSADPYDRERFRAAQMHLFEVEQRQRLAQRDLVLEIAGALTPDERRAYVHWRGPPPRGNGGGPDVVDQQPKQ